MNGDEGIADKGGGGRGGKEISGKTEMFCLSRINVVAAIVVAMKTIEYDCSNHAVAPFSCSVILHSTASFRCKVLQ